MNQSKLIISSLRLPITVTKVDGELRYQESSGGLATGVSTVSRKRNSVWVGWPGISSDVLTQQDKSDIKKELKKQGCHPIFLTQNQIDRFYSGYCNATLWPLLHYFTNKAEHRQIFWESYQEVNKVFSEEISKLVTKDSLLWVHDYQLTLLPQLLRVKYPAAHIGFFLHTPFPSFEIFRLIPQRKELLAGLLGADLVGFHTYDYVRHFLSSVVRLHGHENKLGTIELEDRSVRVDAFPISIDYKKFARVSQQGVTKKLLKSFNIRGSRPKIVLSVDRSDYSKGIPARLRSFDKFLELNPDYRGRVVMMVLAIPSRGDVEAYQELKQDIEQLVSSINGKYATVEWSPIHYRHQALPFKEFSAMYAEADIMLVTPVRDGMNLVAKEYVATHHNRDGVLILSEMAGAASELTDSLLVNPNNYVEVANAIKQALEMPVKEQKQRMKAMQDRVSSYDIIHWAEDYISELQKSQKRHRRPPKQLTSKDTQQIIQEHRKAKNRLLLLDYDGTLINFVKHPQRSLAKPSLEVRKIIKNLTNDSHNHVTIISGRPKTSLETFFKNKGLGLVAEHGGWVFEAGTWIKSGFTFKKWRSELKPVLERFTARTAGSKLETKDFSLVWHYRNVEPDLAYVRKQELKMELNALTEGTDIGVFEGAKMLEIKPQRINKGSVAAELLTKSKWDFVLAIGDDYTDEDMFKVLPSKAHTIHVGPGSTSARYQLKDVKEVLKLLGTIAD